MTFTVTYRGADGAVRTEAVEAANRAECFAQMKARGIVPMGVKEGNFVSRRERSGRRNGGNGSRAERVEAGRGKDGRAGARPSRIAYVLLIALIALAGGGVAWWYFGGRGATALPEPEVPKKPSAFAKEVKPADAPKPVAAPKPVVADAPETNAEPKRVLSKEERIKNLVETHMEKKIDFTPSSNRVFKTSLEQKLAMLFTTRLGAPPPPMPMTVTPVTLLHINEILDAPNPILEGDSPKAVAAKQAVEIVKKEMKDFLAKGGTPEEFLTHYYNQLKEAHDEWKASHFKLIETMKTDPGLAPMVEQELNEALEAKGIRPVQMPPRLKERYGIK